jgi:hypothetical protein
MNSTVSETDLFPSTDMSEKRKSVKMGKRERERERDRDGGIPITERWTNTIGNSQTIKTLSHTQ